MKKVIVFLAAILCAQITFAESSNELIIFDATTKPQIEAKDSNITIGDGSINVNHTSLNRESGVIFKPKAAGLSAFEPREGVWDLSKYREVSVVLANLRNEPVRIYLRIESSNSNITQSVMLDPRQGQSLSTYLMLGPWKFDKSMTLIGLRGGPGSMGDINPSKVTQISIFCEKSESFKSFAIGNLKAKGEFKVLNADTFIPFIDEFGQFVHNDWPGKIHSPEELQKQKEIEAKQLEENPGPNDWDKYGGFTRGPKLNATGYFRVEKSEGKWWMVDPDGNIFWSHGIDCVRMAEATPITDREKYFANLPDVNSPFGKCYGTGAWAPHGYYQQHTPYKTYSFAMANLMRKYGPEWQKLNSEIAHKRLRSWGLNTIANWSSDAFYSMRKTPYVATIGYNAKKIEGSSGYWGKFYDVFDPDFRESVSRRMEREKGKSIGDPWCVGFFVDNELSWGDEISLGLAALASPASQEAKKVFVEDLKAKYQTIEKLNDAWEVNIADWDALLQTKYSPPNKEKWAKTKGYDDLCAFYTKTAETYFAVVRDEVKKVAPNQLYMGCRFAWVNDLAIRASARFCDVVSFNFYEYGIENQKLPDNIDLPIIIGEFHFGALDRGMFHPGLKRAQDQNDRADKYSQYVEGALRNPCIVGTHWFQYQDQPTTGRGDGENYQIGFIDIVDTPYPETIAASQNIGRTMYEYRLKK